MKITNKNEINKVCMKDIEKGEVFKTTTGYYIRANDEFKVLKESPGSGWYIPGVNLEDGTLERFHENLEVEPIDAEVVLRESRSEN